MGNTVCIPGLPFDAFPGPVWFYSFFLDGFRQNHGAESPRLPLFFAGKGPPFFFRSIYIIPLQFIFYDLLSTLSTQFSTYINPYISASFSLSSPFKRRSSFHFWHNLNLHNSFFFQELTGPYFSIIFPLTEKGRGRILASPFADSCGYLFSRAGADGFPVSLFHREAKMAQPFFLTQIYSSTAAASVRARKAAMYAAKPMCRPTRKYSAAIAAA